MTVKKSKKTVKKKTNKLTEEYRKAKQEEILNSSFINYIEGIWSIDDIVRKAKRKESTIRTIMNQEKWDIYKQVFAQTNVFYPRKSRDFYFKMMDKKVYIDPYSGNVNLAPLAEYIKDRYINSFPRTSIETLLSEFGQERYLCHILEIAEKEDWDSRRDIVLKRLKKSRNEEFERRKVAFEDMFHGVLMKRLAIENKQLNGELTFAKGVIKEKNEDGQEIEKTVTEIVKSGFTARDLIDFTANTLYSRSEKPTTQINIQNNAQQVDYTEGMDEKQKADYLKDLQETVKHLAILKQRGKNVLTIEDIRKEENENEENGGGSEETGGEQE